MTSMASEGKNIYLLLIGQAGTGKSALGNSILNKKSFDVKSSTDISSSFFSTDIALNKSVYDGRVIKVVDGIIISNAQINNEVQKKISFTLDKALSVNPAGYHAFLLVLKFGERFTSYHRQSILFLKRIFGDGFLKEFCIIVMTHGDNFEIQSRKSSQTFQQWCENESGEFRDLYMDCNKRIVLFNNETDDQLRKIEQLENLIRNVEQVIFKEQRFNSQMFEEAKINTERLLIEVNLATVRDQTFEKNTSMLHELQLIIEEDDEDENKLDKLNLLSDRAQVLQMSLETQDKGTGMLHDIVQSVNSLHNKIQFEIQYTKRVLQERKRTRQQQAGLEETYQHMLQHQKEDFERRMLIEQQDFERRNGIERSYADERLSNLTNKKEISEMKKRITELNSKLDNFWTQLLDFINPG